MAKVESINLIIRNKSTPSFELEFTLDEVALDITGWTLYFTVKENLSDADSAAKINKKITSHTDAVNGKTTISLTAIDTNLIGQYWYAVDYKDDEGNIDTLYYGKIKFEKSVRNTKD